MRSLSLVKHVRLFGSSPPKATLWDCKARNNGSQRRSLLVVNSLPPDVAVIASSTLQPWFDVAASDLFNAITAADDAVANQLTGITPLSFAIVLGAGLLTSLSPCTLSVLPLTIGYIGGYSQSNEDKVESTSLLARASAFALGLATTFAALGMVSSFVGGAYGQIGDILPLTVSIIAIVMGLNLLEVITFQLPSVDVDIRGLGLPPLAQAYLAGLTFALAASPCSTPVLATLLAYVSTSQDPVTGGALLLAYATGYVAPLLAAAVFTGALKDILAMRQWSGWITPVSGVLLLAGGTYSLLSRVVPP